MTTKTKDESNVSYKQAAIWLAALLFLIVVPSFGYVIVTQTKNVDKVEENNKEEHLYMGLQQKEFSQNLNDVLAVLKVQINTSELIHKSYDKDFESLREEYKVLSERIDELIFEKKQ